MPNGAWYGRPKATPALSKLVRGELAPAQTWETKLTQAGDAETAEQVAAAKSQAWGQLVRERKLGYLALLRNVRNVLTHAHCSVLTVPPRRPTD